jgi:hypothetical protein
MSEKIPNFFLENPNEKWKPAEESAIVIVKKLEGALQIKDHDKVRDILSNPQYLRRLVLNRSPERGKGIVDVRNGFNWLFADKFGPETSLYSMSSEEIFNWLKEVGLPEYTLSNLNTAAYHLKDEKNFFLFLRVALDNENRIEDKTVIATVLHNLATWENMVTGDKEKALEKNKEALGIVRGTQDKALEAKITYGLTFNKDFKSKDSKKKSGDYEEYIQAFYKSGNDFDALQAMNEAAGAFIALAKNQKSPKEKDLHEENLGKVEKLLEKALTGAQELNYTNALVRIYRNLSEFHRIKGENNEANEYQVEANKIKRATGYRY